MKRQTPFKLAAKNTLRVTERDVKDTNLLKTFQGASDLHKQLTRTINNKPKTNAYNPNSTLKMTSIPQQQRSEEQALALQVAALDSFKVVPSKQKTRDLIENIKLRRRNKHLQAYGSFKEDLQDYKQNLNFVYNSLQNDLQQLLTIKENQLNEYFASLSDNFLLQKDRQLLSQIKKNVHDFQTSIKDKLRSSFQQILRIKNDRKGIVEQRCTNLFKQLVQIAFVLQDQARSISDNEKKEMQNLQDDVYNKIKAKLQQMQQSKKQLFEAMNNQSNTYQDKWKTINENQQIENYLTEADTPQLRWPQQRGLLYQKLLNAQLTNSDRKRRLIINLAKQHPDTLNKANIDKWNEHLKMINQAFDKELDIFIKQLMEQSAQSQRRNNQRYEQLRKRLNYIQKRSPEEVEELLKQKCQPNLNRNNNEAKQLLKQSISYVQNADQKQNKSFEKLYNFVSEIALRSDDFSKKWTALNQQFELQKAKILDSDDQVVQQLTNQLNTLKQQLRQALHHIKLEQVQKACFVKIDELENAYRKTHQNNKELAAKRPGNISKFMDNLQAKISQAFSLYDQSKRNQLNEMAKKECEEKATKRWQEEEKKRQEEQSIALQETKKKGGKPPVTKPKDPKKAQAEMEERKKVLMQEIGLRKIEQVKAGAGAVWLAFRSLTQICSEFYKTEQKQASDTLSQQIKNYKGVPLVSQKALIPAKQLSAQLQIIRNKLFQSLSEKRGKLQSETEIIDGKFIDQSLGRLDARLRQHYPLKGKLQAEIGIVRSGQITSHKKEYQKHVRHVKQKMDLQTEKFNYLLQKCLNLFKEHNSSQKLARQNLSKGKTLADFQSCHRKAQQNYKFITRQMQEIGKELNRLATVEVETILHSNEQFLKKSKLLADGGQFSNSQLQWYRKMMQEINGQITQQKEKRNEKSKQIQQQTQKRSKELIQQFDKEYANYIQDLSAKEGTGKKYGKPKRIAQEKLRLQMNKCEQAQISIDKQIQQILDVCHKGYNNYPQKPTFLNWRQKIMTVQTCIVRYAKHIEAIVPNCKAKPMPRITRKEGVSDALLTSQQQEQDKKKILQELSQLGPLGEQKDQKVFMKFLDDIQKIIGDEARTIYVGDKAKYITGNDKIPDFLRLYIQNMRKNAEQFRQQSIRSLRESCNKLAQSVNLITDLFYGSILGYFGGNQTSLSHKCRAKLSESIKQNIRMRQQNLKKLRPNLVHPDCQKQLKALDQKQQQRQKSFNTELLQQKSIFENELFANASELLYTILNNYEMLILLFDSLYLQQDFVKVSGDDAEQKIHLDQKRLLLMKQKGINIDANSERNIKKKWEGANCTIFNFGDKKFINVVKAPQEPKEKDKKASKKDTKTKLEEVAPVSNDTSKVIETYKTWRQKCTFTGRENVLGSFKVEFDKYLSEISREVEDSLKENQSFKLKWEAIAKTLYIS